MTFLAIGGTSARSAALFGGTIDAALVVAPDNYPLESKGYRRLLLASDYVNYPLSGVAASADFLAKNKPVAIAFLKGLLEGAKFVRQNKGDSVTFIKSYLKVPDDEAEKSYEFSDQGDAAGFDPGGCRHPHRNRFRQKRSQIVTRSGPRYLQSPRLVIRRSGSVAGSIL